MENRFETFTWQITKINRSIRRIKNDVMSEYDLKVPHANCIYYLHKYGQLTAKELCEFCDEDKSGISRSVEILEKEGYLTCADGQKKRYKSPLKLTEKGENVAQVINERIEQVLDISSKGLTEKEREKFYQALSLISENLQNVSDGK